MKMTKNENEEKSRKKREQTNMKKTHEEKLTKIII